MTAEPVSCGNKNHLRLRARPRPSPHFTDRKIRWRFTPDSDSDQSYVSKNSVIVEAAIRYLETLTGEMLDTTLNYIRRAPLEVQTPVREAVNVRWPEAVKFH